MKKHDTPYFDVEDDFGDQLEAFFQEEIEREEAKHIEMEEMEEIERQEQDDFGDQLEAFFQEEIEREEAKHIEMEEALATTPGKNQINWEALSEFNHPLINTICELDKKINSGELSKKHGEILVQQQEKAIANATKVDSLMEQLKEKAPETQRAFYVLAAQRATRSYENVKTI